MVNNHIRYYLYIRIISIGVIHCGVKITQIWAGVIQRPHD